MNDYGEPTTLKFSRQMRQNGIELAGCVEHYRKSPAERAAGVALGFFIAFALAMALVSWWTS